MKQEQQQAIALMRYGAIAPLVTGLDDRYPSMQAYYEEVSAKGLTGPDGRNHHFAPSTIERWSLDYKKHGFDSLIPAARAAAGWPRRARNRSVISNPTSRVCPPPQSTGS